MFFLYSFFYLVSHIFCICLCCFCVLTFQALCLYDLFFKRFPTLCGGVYWSVRECPGSDRAVLSPLIPPTAQSRGRVTWYYVVLCPLVEAIVYNSWFMVHKYINTVSILEWSWCGYFCGMIYSRRKRPEF